VRNIIQLFGWSCQLHLWDDAGHKIQCSTQSTRKWNSRQDILIIVWWTNSEGICIIEIISYTAAVAHLLMPIPVLTGRFITTLLSCTTDISEVACVPLYYCVMILCYFSTVTDKLADLKKLFTSILEVLNWNQARTVSILRFVVVLLSLSRLS
jgi:hypothetical protein